MPSKQVIIKTIELPTAMEKELKAEYKKMEHADLALPEFLKMQTAEYSRVQALIADPSQKYAPELGKITPCGGGDFEKEIDDDQWQAAFGSLRPPFSFSVNFPFANFTSGFSSGAIGNAVSHQTWVGTGTDPNAPIATTAQGSNGAVRIGNSVSGFGCELLSKTFVVPASQQSITFWYATVMQNPTGHPPSQQPLFWVRVTDATGNIVPGAFDFGDGSDKLIADATNPFFTVINGGSGTVVYKDWSCAQIDLSTMVGKQVTIEFVSGDCGQGAHWGYAYIDNFCGTCAGSPTGNLTYNCEASDHCGKGEICFDYELPKATDAQGNVLTGQVEIELMIFQNGTQLSSVNSGPLSSGSKHCFLIDPAGLPGVDLTKPGIDFSATAKFKLGSTNLGTMKVGAVPDGVSAGQNNDYAMTCKTCSTIRDDQNDYLERVRDDKVNVLSQISCNCGEGQVVSSGKCDCKCEDVDFPKIEPCISIAWGDSKCDGIETSDTEVVVITVFNCYSNITFADLSIGQIVITDLQGNPVASLPNGKPSVQIVPSGPVCFGDIGPCEGKDKPRKVSREFMMHTEGALHGEYKLSIEGVCFEVRKDFQSEQCFLLKLCKD